MAAAASFAAVSLLVLVALRERFLLEKRLPIGDGNLVVVGMDFGEGEKTVPIAAIVDESGLERRLYPSDLGEVDIPTQRPLIRRLEVKFLDPVASEDHHPGFLWMGGVDDHFVGHGELSRRASKYAARAERAARLRRARRLCWRWGKYAIGKRAPPLQ